MTTEDYKRLIKALLEFVERASKTSATQEELAVLPMVADVLVKINT